MSNHIEQLYQQSFTEHSYQALVDGEIGDEPRYKTTKFSHFDHTKFANLIVQECARIAEQSDDSWTGAGSEAAAQIKAHFGVEDKQ